ncbi:MAG: DAK2 domain-containing protein [Lachnospiraceae bacterium]|nr:DAK2 domain-containing protein [Lachnospiraceae bacterium]
MSIKQIAAEKVQKCFLAGAYRLEAKKEYINELNVFPVPDGDTGTNMSLTIMAAAKEVSALSDASMEQVMKAVSSGSLRGARGNSGVILSQLFRGFSKVASKHDKLDTFILADAFNQAVATAYKAVMKPKEGTILTVAKAMAKKGDEVAGSMKDIEQWLEAVVTYGDETLEKTPDMLPVLKEAGVVDSGGQGLMEVMHGILDEIKGIETVIETPVVAAKKIEISEEEPVDIKFGYCTEFIILLEKEFTSQDEMELKEYLGSIGDSLVVVADDEIVKIHVHTNHPGLAFEKGLTYGALSRMKIDNMREEHQEKLIKDAEKLAKEQSEKEELEKTALPLKEYGFVTICAGKGMEEIFTSLGADVVIEGGQTMNPSTEDILNAIAKINAKNIFILPNNKNIILAANQARDLTEDKNIVVIETKTIPQGISAMIGFDENAELEDNLQSMKDMSTQVLTGQITYAVRDTNIEGKEIHNGDFMGMNDKGLVSVGTDKEKVSLELLENMVQKDSELITIYYGTEVGEVEANSISEKISQCFPSVEVELQCGGQPVYYYIFSVE